MKNFTVTSIVPDKHTPETFVVEIKLMHGDADMYETLEVGPFKTDQKEALTSLVETLDRMKAQYPNGRGGDWERYGYHRVEGFPSWFDREDVDNESEYREVYSEHVPYDRFVYHSTLADSIGYFYWPWDCTGAEVEASVSGYEVFYYDENLKKYLVEVS